MKGQRHLAIGLVVKGGKEFIDKWLESASQLGQALFVVDNGADEEVRQKLINYPRTLRYLIQKTDRNMSRDYQKLLDMAREENFTWLFNMDIDEGILNSDYRKLYDYLLNTRDDSVGFPMFELRNDSDHYVMVKDCTTVLKHARLVHKCFKILSHFKYNEMDLHGQAIPHNCKVGETYNMIMKHYGHMTKELRDKKREYYKSENKGKDSNELEQTWMEEDESKITIKSISELLKNTEHDKK